MKKLSIISALMLIVMLAGCAKIAPVSSSEVTSTPLSKIENEFKNINPETGAFTVAKGGVVPNTAMSIAPFSVDSYFDPACPPCIMLEMETADYFTEKLNAGEISITYHPLMFLSRGSIDNYSGRLAGYAIAVAEYAPQSAIEFVKTILHSDFLPKVVYEKDKDGKDDPSKAYREAKSDEDIYATLTAVGVTPEQLTLIKDNLETMIALSTTATEVWRSDVDLRNLSPSEQDGEKYIFTPFMLINRAGEFTSTAMAFDTDNLIDELDAKFAELAQ